MRVSFCTRRNTVSNAAVIRVSHQYGIDLPSTTPAPASHAMI
ncbi:hypothetical protein DB32_007161 [Sandaracinus amylolyticus]|uniref:Uncharacterized protein n=1 Tax=Sandaracinus amylolyticus TaxID=927083 RepID=A0A0F6W890_9BACT|nr:hypothetical protein DB32_007161 [Sandaracinus amylolyticus]